MSINSAMLAGVSGLTANSSALAAISDNIANVNTVGYKRAQVDFSTIVTSQSLKASYSAGGVLGTARQFVSQQGLLQRTTSNTDLGVQGKGFFVVTEKPENLTSTDARLFTRAGSFTKDDLGYLRNASGLYLQGWPIDDQGNVISDPSDLTRLQTINVTSIGGAADPTTRATINANLKSSQAVSADAATYNPTVAATSMAAYDPANGTGVKPDFELQIPVSDSKGGKRTVAVSFLKSPNANEWYAEIRAIPASDVVTATPLQSGQLATGIVRFTADGRYDAANSTLFPAPPAAPELQFGASAGAVPVPGSGTFNWDPSLGVAAQTLRIDLDSAAGGLTQFDSQSVVQAVLTNGTTFGNLTNIEIDDEGFVTAIFDNGVTRKIAQVALATFPNDDGLIRVSGNAYRVSQESGTYNLKPPGQGGAGLLSPSTLEASTVDLSSEFTGLITTQRAYSASSKIITTADQMLEELLMIKR
ncbi:flagellar hook protein FlgE [Caulobacter sp. 17J80-11]|uniref:flagellar hook protein FlgE n=1 Tax=Caulobacter sp. 17J80-11 TaxID=2763502 RepID=UPI00165391AE|nr:flagellar hook protein FlgE [Caulobacter sp. 17J80-11]MBC6982631.1 flagellar hook protein FlgE [Caulobacter sp. 17J80-11]